MRGLVIGRYYPADSLIHRLDPRMKIYATILLMVSIMLARSLPGFILITAALAGLIYLSKVPFGMMIGGLKPLRMILILTFIFSLFGAEGTVWAQIGPFTATYEGCMLGIRMVLRLAYLVIGSSLMTLTTTPGQLTAGIEQGFGFLGKVGVPMQDVAMMRSIALRFIPILTDEMRKVMLAQKARGVDFESGSLKARAQKLVPLIVPLFVSAIRRAGDLAVAMEARCYGIGPHTRMHPLKMTFRDRIGMASMAALTIAMLVLEYVVI